MPLLYFIDRHFKRLKKCFNFGSNKEANNTEQKFTERDGKHTHTRMNVRERYIIQKALQFAKELKCLKNKGGKRTI